MIKRTIDISEGPSYLSIENDQLVVSRDGQVVGRVPSEDIGVLLVDHYATMYTQSVFTRLVHHGAVVIICGPNHLPAALARIFHPSADLLGAGAAQPRLLQSDLGGVGSLPTWDDLLFTPLERE